MPIKIHLYDHRYLLIIQNNILNISCLIYETHNLSITKRIYKQILLHTLFFQGNPMPNYNETIVTTTKKYLCLVKQLILNNILLMEKETEYLVTQFRYRYVFYSKVQKPNYFNYVLLTVFKDLFLMLADYQVKAFVSFRLLVHYKPKVYRGQVLYECVSY